MYIIIVIITESTIIDNSKSDNSKLTNQIVRLVAIVWNYLSTIIVDK